MTEQGRPGLAIRAASGAFDGNVILPAELAHRFGLGVSQTDLAAASRRGLASLRECWPEVVAQSLFRALQQALLEALPAYWCRRAEVFERVGSASADSAAVACRRHAWLLAQGLSPDLAAELDDYLAEVV